MTVCHFEGQRSQSGDLDGLLVMHAGECGGLSGACDQHWVGDQGRGPGWPLVQSSMPIEEKKPSGCHGHDARHWVAREKGTYYPQSLLLWPHELLFRRRRGGRKKGLFSHL